MNSILDRGGVPKVSQLDVEGRLSISSALAEVLDIFVGETEGGADAK